MGTCMCAGFKIKINGCKSFVIPDYEDNCYRLDFSGVTIPCLIPMANLHPLSVRMNWCILIFTAAILIFFPTLQFLMTKVVLDVESRRDWRLLDISFLTRHKKDLNQNKYVPVVILKTYNAPLLDFNYCMKEWFSVDLLKHNVSSTITNTKWQEIHDCCLFVCC